MLLFRRLRVRQSFLFERVAVTASPVLLFWRNANLFLTRYLYQAAYHRTLYFRRRPQDARLRNSIENHPVVSMRHWQVIARTLHAIISKQYCTFSQFTWSRRANALPVRSQVLLGANTPANGY